MSLNGSSWSFARSIQRPTPPPSAAIAWSISRTSWFAPPWSGPHRAAIPADTETYRLACDEPTSRTVEVEQFCSWSACRMSSVRSAALAFGSTTYGSDGTANIMRRKFAS